MFNREAFSSQRVEIQYFEYFLLKVFDLVSRKRNNTINDLSVLKCQKLLFFSVAINTQSVNDKSYLGTQIFTDFKAYQYGPVEETIYEALRDNNNRLSHVRLSFQKLELNDPNMNIVDLIAKIVDSGLLQSRALRAIDEALHNLNRRNPFLFLYTAFDLVELSHRWRCWSFTYDTNPRGPILLKDIENESMLFSL